MRVFKLTIFAAVIAAFTAVTAIAQVTGGAVTGSIIDSNGAVIPNATVKLSDKLRGQEYTAQTTGAGSYLFANVATGTYTLNVTANGFTSTTRELKVSLNQTTSAEVVLAVSGSSATVDVIAGSEALVQTETSQIGRTFETRAILELPINGDPNNLAVLAPNVVPAVGGTSGSGGVSGGVRARANSFNIDGVDNNDPSVTGPSTGPIQDAVQEFTLLQNNFNAEFGAGAGGQFNTITKSGTNDYHGSVFTYIGSQRLNSSGTDETSQGFKNFFKEARYGGTVGGPIPYPNFGEGGPRFRSGKNKLFFFGAYEKYFQTGQASSGSFIAPTLAGLNQLAALPGVSAHVINILRNTLTLAPNADFLSGDPNDPNTVVSNVDTLGVNGVPFGNVILPIPASQEQKSYQLNIDHLPNENNQFRYRYSRTRYAAEQPGLGGLSFNNLLTYDTDLFSVNYIKTFSSTVVNDLRLSYLKTTTDFPLKDQSLSNFPNLEVLSLALEIGPQSNLPQSGFDNNYQIYDSITWVTGPHTFKFGADYRRYHGGTDFLPRARGEYDYTTFDLLLRDLIPDSVNKRGIGSGSANFDNHRFFTFAQDDWKIRPNFTINLGIRYEYQGLYRDAADQISAAPANVPGIIEFNIPKEDKNNIAPRLGIAWSPTWDNTVGRFLFGGAGQSSIRANFSRAYFPNFSNFVINSLPPTKQGELDSDGSATAFLQNGGAGSTPFVPNLDPANLRNVAGSFILPQIVPYADSIAVSYQRQIGTANGLEVRYLRTRARSLPVQVQLNSRTVVDAALVLPTFLNTPSAATVAALPTIASVVAANPLLSPVTFLAPRQLGSFGFNGVLTAFPDLGKSDYSAVSASLTRRFTKNVGFTAAYTFSRTKDNSTNELFTSALNPRRAQDAGEFFGGGLNIDQDYGVSVLDVPHRFVTSFNLDIPFFNNSDNPFLKTVLGGFSINGIFQVQSGQPITVQAGRDANRNGDGAGDRALFNPDGDPLQTSAIMGVTLVGGVVTLVPVGAAPDPNVRAYVATNPNAGYISTGFFAAELAGNGAGTAPRNSFRTNGYNSTDLVVVKNTRFGRDGRFNFQVGAEIFDLFNQRPQTVGGVNGLASDTSAGAFAIAGNANFNNYSLGTYPGRSVRMRAKFIF
ncbi:MAG: carboxypeptidase regulatory-like domain-containing protein [Pyrinomonadaceae bacterium]